MKLICYLSNGYPTLNASKMMAENYVNAGCDVIEIDFPSHDPFLENEFIADRMKIALENCDDYDAYMREMIEIKNGLPQTKFILMVYENTILEIGSDKFIRFCLKNGFADIILVGIKEDKIKSELIRNNLRVSCYVQYQLLDEEVEQAKNSNGFVYLQAKPTQGIINQRFPLLKNCIDFLRDQGIDRPIYCGVGIRTPEDILMVKESGANGVFVGSAILKLHENLPMLVKTIKEYKAACD
ncbi:tryptophan synthase subunit alpha [Sporolactobacillus pectinivorans]|uniref:tryptophan synthase subunit alpha n=1 Tax=Sporolactobacillus pectinivorans TaxID=1591408 RepID=UPI000C268732|nr:tryptophan synthase subunit alpha [Sporolactobacillus pectinivorans]